jgi:hypothetical protein
MALIPRKDRVLVQYSDPRQLAHFGARIVTDLLLALPANLLTAQG